MMLVIKDLESCGLPAKFQPMFQKLSQATLIFSPPTLARVMFCKLPAMPAK